MTGAIRNLPCGSHLLIITIINVVQASIDEKSSVNLGELNESYLH